MLTKCRNKHRWPYIPIPIFRVSNLLTPTSLLFRPFLQPFRFLSSSCPITTFLLRKCFPRPYKHTPEPEAKSQNLLMPEGKASPRKLSKDKGSILRVWRAAWFPTAKAPSQKLSKQHRNYLKSVQGYSMSLFPAGLNPGVSFHNHSLSLEGLQISGVRPSPGI